MRHALPEAAIQLHTDYAYACAAACSALLGLKLGRLIISYSAGMIVALDSILVILKIDAGLCFANLIFNLLDHVLIEIIVNKYII